jgi:hypothetical protein
MSNEKKIEYDGSPDPRPPWPGLYVRQGDRIVEAPAEDQAVAKGYPDWPDKGVIWRGLRITIMTKKQTYEVEEEVRVLHVFEATEPGKEAYVMGPKPVYGEYVDGKLVTAPPPDVNTPWVPTLYDGPVLPGPAVDYNYDITTYTFNETGAHQIYWQLGPLRSNVLEVEIVEAD